LKKHSLSYNSMYGKSITHPKLRRLDYEPLSYYIRTDVTNVSEI